MSYRVRLGLLGAVGVAVLTLAVTVAVASTGSSNAAAPIKIGILSD